MELLREKSWSPYAVGAGIGLLEIAAILTARRPLGITSAFEDTAALAAGAMAPQAMDVAAYERARGEAPRIGWGTTLVAGVLLGSAMSARLSGAGRPPRVPDLWRRHMGGSLRGRQAAALAGGARFTPIMFGTAAAVARALFGRES